MATSKDKFFSQVAPDEVVEFEDLRNSLKEIIHFITSSSHKGHKYSPLVFKKSRLVFKMVLKN